MESKLGWISWFCWFNTEPCRWNTRQDKFIPRHFTFDVFVEHIIDNRIDVLINVFEQDWEAVFDGQLQLLQEIMIIERNHL